MRILVAGGGSGGHVTPVLAILEALAKQDPHLEVCFVCDRRFAPQARIILAHSPISITLKTVSAGKFRRYNGVSLWRQLLDIPTVLRNMRDIFLTFIGLFQSFWIIGRFKPQVVFGKGGFVCMPVGIAAHLRGLPLVIHDSDAHPGLTNRVLSRWATFIATGAPLENYSYKKSISRYVGIPVATYFRALSTENKQKLHRKIMKDPTRDLVVVTGGGLGARRLNKAVSTIAPSLLAGKIEIIHITGAALEKEVLQARNALPVAHREFYRVEPFVNAATMAELFGAATVVVSRAGATALAELAAMHKPTVLVPNPQLTGGQQLKNAKVLEEAQAAVIVDENRMNDNYVVLQHAILWVIRNKHTQRTLEKQIAAFAKPQAAEEVAKLIIQAKEQGR